MATFVLIPGGWRGGWWYEPLATRLRQAGHAVYAVTLAGLEDTPASAAGINLDTHIADVVALLTAEDLSEVILCAHSYGGMVASGAADRLPERLAALIYLDAFAPEHDQAWWDLAGDDYRGLVIAQAGHDGLTVLPRDGVDPRCRPHPLGTFVQRLRLTRPQPDMRRVFVYATGWRATPFTAQYERLRDDPAWDVRTVASAHDLIQHAPDETFQVLTDVAGELSPR
ncbi:putative esterase [Bradyrhizobium sp. ORS 375]|uniref:alpha/beta fold hydrolase n=1 Tax=Bradyrhizobium sp. (strain ORS 375) TaxID=566679 RepID=UPI0002406426|nr:alpha/beta hydrolase [Bradyrhizobium sp. ORS 375]CCD94831.1 putative esterase [Bradyrhizobium sp. ORS 375]